MKNGHRWLAFDADFAFNPFTTQLIDQFGAAGAYVFVAFLCACKRSGTPGAITYASELDLVSGLGISTIPLVNNEGVPWSMEELFQFTGRQKQTKKTRLGARWKIEATHWGDWQKGLRTQENTQRKAQKRMGHDADTLMTGERTDCGHADDAMRPEKRGEEKRSPLPPNGGKQAPPAHASPPPTPATPKPPCAACGAPAFLQDAGANLCLRCYELGAVVVPVKKLT